MKIQPVGAVMFHADGRRQTDRQTDMTKPIVAFPTIENAPKNSTFCPDRICVFCIYLGTNSDF